MIGQQILKSITVLYCEDSKMMRLQMGKFLEEHFSKVIIAEDGEDGFNKYKENKEDIDLIISDIVMPNVTGLEMVSKIRDIDPLIPCILATSIIEANAFVEAIKLNVTSYVLKPIDYDQLLSTLINTAIHITTKQISLQQEYEIKRYIEAINDISIISKTDLNGMITYANEEFCNISKYSMDELLGANHNIVRAPDVQQKVYEGMWKLIQSGKTWKGTIKNIAKDGSIYYVKSNVFPLFDNQNKIKEYMAIRFLVTDEEEEKRTFRKGIVKHIADGKSEVSHLKDEIEKLKEEKTKLIRLAIKSDENKVIPLEQEIVKLKSTIKKLEEQNLDDKIYNPHKKLEQSGEIDTDKIQILEEENKKLKNIIFRLKEQGFSSKL